MTTQFTDLNLRPELVEAVAALGYTAPTPIQTAVIPHLLTATDVVGQAQTGTGKTAAFSLPILHNLHPEQTGIQGLILAPTRELAQQVARAIYEYGKNQKVRVLCITGGQPYSRQKRRLERGVDIVVGTPGRLLDLLKQGALDLSQLRTLVLDEADEMLSMGFIEDIEAILEATPAERQTALFSATMPPAIRRLAEKYMREPEAVTITAEQKTVATIEEKYYLVNEEDKVAALTRLFESEEVTSALIFAQTRVTTGHLANALTRRGIPAEVLNGDLSQEAREAVTKRFRNKKLTVLVATDIAARGLDVDGISHVFNFDLPQYAEVYVHRVGRTGRAGASGTAITLVTPKEQWRLRRIEKYTRHKIAQAELPTEADIKALRESQLLEKMLVWVRRGRCNREKELIEGLVAEGHDLLEVAAAALKLAQSEDKKRPIEPVSEVRLQPERRPQNGRNGRGRANDRRGNGRYSDRRSNGRSSNGNGNGNNGNHGKPRRSHESGMVRLILSAGRRHGVRPNDVVGTIARHADIPGYSIGAIHIEDHQTLVDIPEKHASSVLGLSGEVRLRNRFITVTN